MTAKRIIDHLAPSDWTILVAIAMQAAVVLWRITTLEGQVKLLDDRLWNHIQPTVQASFCPPDATAFPLATVALRPLP